MPDSLPFSPFEVRDDSNPSGDGLSHLNRIKLGGAATTVPKYIGRIDAMFTLLGFDIRISRCSRITLPLVDIE